MKTHSRGTVRLLLTALALAIPLSACGKKGSLEPPPGKESLYPRQYPAPEPYPSPEEPEEPEGQ